VKRALLLVVLLFAVGAWPQEKKPNPYLDLVLDTKGSSHISFIATLKDGPNVEIIYIDHFKEKGERRGIIRIYDKNNKLVVDVDESGKAVYGEGYAGNDAARIFWKALADYYPPICEQQKVKP